MRLIGGLMLYNAPDVILPNGANCSKQWAEYVAKDQPYIMIGSNLLINIDLSKVPDQDFALYVFHQGGIYCNTGTVSAPVGPNGVTACWRSPDTMDSTIQTVWLFNDVRECLELNFPKEGADTVFVDTNKTPANPIITPPQKSRYRL